jgi:hypothetical protein
VYEYEIAAARDRAQSKRLQGDFQGSSAAEASVASLEIRQKREEKETAQKAAEQARREADSKAHRAEERSRRDAEQQERSRRYESRQAEARQEQRERDRERREQADAAAQEAAERARAQGMRDLTRVLPELERLVEQFEAAPDPSPETVLPLFRMVNLAEKRIDELDVEDLETVRQVAALKGRVQALAASELSIPNLSEYSSQADALLQASNRASFGLSLAGRRQNAWAPSFKGLLTSENVLTEWDYHVSRIEEMQVGFDALAKVVRQCIKLGIVTVGPDGQLVYPSWYEQLAEEFVAAGKVKLDVGEKANAEMLLSAARLAVTPQALGTEIARTYVVAHEHMLPIVDEAIAQAELLESATKPGAVEKLLTGRSYHFAGVQSQLPSIKANIVVTRALSVTAVIVAAFCFFHKGSAYVIGGLTALSAILVFEIQGSVQNKREVKAAAVVARAIAAKLARIRDAQSRGAAPI